MFTLRARNYRCLADLEWRPEDVNVFVGVNGTGKSSLVDLLCFLRTAFGAGSRAATAEFPCRSGDVFVELRAEDGSWDVTFDASGHVVESWNSRRALFERELPPALERAVRAFSNLEIGCRFEGNPSPSLWEPVARRVAEGGSQAEWITTVLRDAFPHLMGSLAFCHESSRSASSLGFQKFDGGFESLANFPSGLLLGLHLLSQVLEARAGCLLVLEDVERSLHPHALRHLLAAVIAVAKMKSVILVLTTHSPVVLDAFQSRPHQVFLLEGGRATALTDLHDRDWLAQQRLGDLYSNLALGTPGP